MSIITRYANATTLEVGPVSISSYPRIRGAKLAVEAYTVDEVFLHANLTFSSPTRHARWARSITLQVLRRGRKAPFRTFINRKAF